MCCWVCEWERRGESIVNVIVFFEVDVDMSCVGLIFMDKLREGSIGIWEIFGSGRGKVVNEFYVGVFCLFLSRGVVMSDFFVGGGDCRGVGGVELGRGLIVGLCLKWISVLDSFC